MAAGRMTRRRLVRNVAVAGAAAALSEVGAASPGRAAAPIVLLFYDWSGWRSHAGPQWMTFQRPMVDYFERTHPGVRVMVGGPLNGSSLVSILLSGNGPDVFQDWVLSPYIESGLALNLAPYIRRDNLQLSTWSPGQLNAMMTPAGIWALPTYVHVDAIAINLSSMDDLVLAYPDPDCTYEDALKLWSACSYVKGNQRHYGVTTNFPGNAMGSSTYVAHLWGGAVKDPTGTVCTVDRPEAYRGIGWYQMLYQQNIAGGPSTYSYTFEQESFRELGSNSLVNQLAAWRNSFKWTYFPPPVFPGGRRATFEADDAYLINAQTKHPDAAWELLKFLTSDPWSQRYRMKYLLVTPSMVSMWDEWAYYVEQAAPVARGKNIRVFAEAAANWGVAARYFRYDDPVVTAIIDNAVAAAFDHKADLATALRVAAAAVNAHEAAAARASRATVAEFATINAALAQARLRGAAGTLPAPPVSGVGAPPSPAAAGAVTVARGVFRVVGTGPGLKGRADGLTLACLPWTGVRGTFTCRVTGLAPLGGALQNGAKVGLVVRGDLSSEAAMASLAVAAGRGVHAASRPVPAAEVGDQRPGSSPGLFAAAEILQPVTAKVSNYMVRPVWLRLVQDVNTWTPYTSLDGRTWVAAGSPMGIEAAGAWVGIFATPNDPDPAHRVEATFDHLSWSPNAFYQVG